MFSDWNYITISLPTHNGDDTPQNLFLPSDGRVSVLLKVAARVRSETVTRLLQLVRLNIVYFDNAVENLNDNGGINRASDTIKQNLS